MTAPHDPAHELWRIASDSPKQIAKDRVARVAGRQFGMVATRQLGAMGASTATISHWTATAYLHLVLPGVYAVGHARVSTEGRLAAALLYAGPGAALAGATALWWWSLVDKLPSAVEVITPRRVRSVKWVKVRARRAFTPVWHNGLPVTDIPRAMLDFAAGRNVTDRQLRHALANADYRGLLDHAAIGAVLQRGAPGSAKLRRALQRHEPQLARTRSELERLFTEVCEEGGIELPIFNVKLNGMLIDALWPAERVAVELDGHGGHRTRAQLEKDHAWDLNLRTAGFVPLRYTWNQLSYERKLVIPDVKAALARKAA